MPIVREGRAEEGRGEGRQEERQERREGGRCRQVPIQVAGGKNQEEAFRKREGRDVPMKAKGGKEEAARTRNSMEEARRSIFDPDVNCDAFTQTLQDEKRNCILS